MQRSCLRLSICKVQFSNIGQQWLHTAGKGIVLRSQKCVLRCKLTAHFKLKETREYCSNQTQSPMGPRACSSSAASVTQCLGNPYSSHIHFFPCSLLIVLQNPIVSKSGSSVSLCSPIQNSLGCFVFILFPNAPCCSMESLSI